MQMTPTLVSIMDQKPEAISSAGVSEVRGWEGRGGAGRLTGCVGAFGDVEGGHSEDGGDCYAGEG